jgi:lysozyme
LTIPVTSQQQFLDKIIPQAIEACNEAGFKVPSLLIAQACLESGWNKSSLAYRYNNLLGRKYATNNVITKVYVTLKTQEWVGDHYVTVYSKFCVYDSIKDCFRDYLWLLHNAKLSGGLRYQRVLDSKDYMEATQAIKDCGYATSPTYPTSLRTIINKYNLSQYDK